MGFAAEMKDFSAGMSSAGKFWDSRADRKLKQAKADSYKVTDSDLNGQPNTFTGTGGTGMVPPPTGGGGKYYDATEPADSQIGAARHAISDNESNSNYGATGIIIPKTGDKAYGKYQIMGANIPSWTKQYLGQSMTPEEFLKNPEAQDKVFDGEFGRLADKYGWGGAAQAWLGGEGSVGQASNADPLGTSVGKYSSAFLQKFNQYGGGGQSMTAGAKPAPSTSRSAVASGDDESPAEDAGEGGEEGGDGEDTGTDTSQVEQAQPVQTAQAAPLVPPPEQGAIPAAPSSPAQFASAQGSGFAQAPTASAQPSQQAQPAQVAAAQPRAMNQGAGVSRVADAMMTPEEQLRQKQLQKGRLFAKDGGVIPDNFGTPDIEKYYARGGTVPKVEHQGTSEWIYDHLPAWLTGEDQPPDTAATRASHSAKPVVPSRGQKEENLPYRTGPREGPQLPANFPKGERPVPADTQSKEDRDAQPTDASGTAATLSDRAAADRRTVPPPAQIDTSRRQQESMDMTSGPREPPAIPVPEDDAQALTDDRNRQMGAQRNSVDKLRERMGAPGGNAPGEQMGPPAPPPQTVSQQVSAGAEPVIPERGQKEPTSPPVIPPDQPHTMSRALRPDEQEAPTATAPTQGPPDQTVAQRVSAQARPVIPERGQKEDVPPTSAAQPQAADDYDPLAAWKDADTDRLQTQTRDMTSGPREPPPGQPPQQAAARCPHSLH